VLFRTCGANHLRRRLPDFMLPSAFIRLDALPRLPNGKMDRAALPMPDFSVPADVSADTGVDAAQATLLAIWRGVLGRPDIGADDNFFEAGGDSILAIQAVSRAREAGFAMSPRDVFVHGSVSALAAHCPLTAASAQTHRTALHGEAALIPAQRAFFDLSLDHPAHWNQSLLLAPREALDELHLGQALQHLQDAHDVLRARFEQRDGRWIQIFGDAPAIPLTVVRMRTDDVAGCIESHAQVLHAGFDLAQAPLCAVAYFDLSTPDGPVRRLFIACHHLVIDGVSWRILLQDLQRLHGALARGQDATLPPRSASPADWSHWLTQQLPRFESERDYWHAQSRATAPLPRDHTLGANSMASVATVSVALDADDTKRLLHALPQAYRARADELLLTALRDTLCGWTGQDTLHCMLESHGRGIGHIMGHTIGHLMGHGADGVQDMPDLTRTMGWFTAFHPLRLERTAGSDDDAIKSVKAALHAVPHGGIGHGVLRTLSGVADAALHARPEVRVNYLGQTDPLFGDDAAFSPASEATGRARHPDDARDVVFDINALVARGSLQLHWSYSTHLHREDTVRRLAGTTLARLRQLVAHCLSEHSDGGLLPQDFPLMQLQAGELDALLDSL
jgi:non-ribosomal peptide synthase protein (TIGR01720 family)